VTKAFEALQDHYEKRDQEARAWKKDGGRVVGYFCDSVPEEIILAAGFFPFRLSGNPSSGTDVARKYVIPRFTAREEFVHSMLNMLLTGAYDFLDYLIIPHSRDSIHRLYQLLAMIKANEPELKLPELFFLDTLHTVFFSSSIYERERMIELKDQLEQWSGNEITSEELKHAIATTNENKQLLKQVTAHRASPSPRISGTQALKIIGSAMVMMKSEHNKLVKSFLEEEISNLPVKKGKRTFISGSPLDHTQVYECIESSDAVIVGEDHCWGNRYSDVPINTTLDPLEAIIDRYHFKTPCSRMFPMNRRIEYCIREAENAGAEQVLFFVYKHDNAEAWEVPEKVKALAKKGIPSVVLKNQPYVITDPEKLKADIHEQEVKL
jgi:benzoyl-CoA reductase/2-hydroxyglutaryl-CoA dehydratase subunit BcrC/BadD/HgdB